MTQVIVALDLPSRDRALSLVDALGAQVETYKVGLELFTHAGPSVVSDLKERGKGVFLDLKLYDIPNTVAAAVSAAADHGADLLTLHASGGRDMLERAVEAAAGRLRLLGVTVLTSLGPEGLAEAWGRSGIRTDREVERLAGLTLACGLDGVVASAEEAAILRNALGPSALIVTPGIRPAGATPHDQRRVATPEAAVQAGADALVVGRPVTESEDPRAALHSLRREVAAADGVARPYSGPEPEGGARPPGSLGKGGEG